MYTIRKVSGAKCAAVVQALALELFKPAEVDMFCDTTVGEWWLAYHQGTPVAFAGQRIATTDPSALFLCLAGVLPSHRGKGLQRRLIQKRVQRAREQGFARVISYTMVTNTPSSNNLIREGFRLYWPTAWFGGHNDVNYWTMDLHA